MTDREKEAYALLALIATTGGSLPASAQQLAALGPAALPAIEQALALRDPAARRAAVAALCEINDAAAVGPLMTFCDTHAAHERDLVARAVGALQKIGESDVALPSLSDFIARHAVAPDPLVRAAIADLAASTAPPEVLEVLVRLVRDPYPAVSDRAQRALAAVAADDPAPTVRAALGVGDPQRREIAVRELIARPDAAVLLRPLLSGADEYALRGALEAARLLADAALNDLLIRLADDERAAGDIRIAALGAMQPRGELAAEVLRRLDAALRSQHPALRDPAAEVLAAAQSRDALRLLARVLPEADVSVLERAATSWARHGSRIHGLLVPPATAALERLAHTRFADPEAARAVLAILRALLAAHLAGVATEPSVLAAVARWTWSPDSKVSALARRVLDALSQPPATAEADATDDPVRALLARAEHADLLSAAVALGALSGERLVAYADAIIDALYGADDDALVAFCPILARLKELPRVRGYVDRLPLHPSAAVRAAAATEAGAAPAPLGARPEKL